MTIMDIYPDFSKGQSAEEKEKLTGQHGITVWFTGLSGSGKSSVSVALERLLSSKGHLCAVLDGDNIRSGLNSDLGFSEADRMENIRRIAEVCRLMNGTGVIALAAFVSPTEDCRRMAKKIVGKERFCEVYVSTPISECERRDVKGLYARARRGEVSDFTGISAPFDIPSDADVCIDTTGRQPEDCAKEILAYISGLISLEDNQVGHEEGCL